MGKIGTHPWSQGFPLTTQLPEGPEMPANIHVNAEDLKYPKAWGLPELREAIAGYYNHYYSAGIDYENIMVFAGGRPGLITLLMFLQQDIHIRIASTEYTPYYDMLRLLKREYSLVGSHVDNSFFPTVQDYVNPGFADRNLEMLSNPCNPTGVTRTGDELKSLVNKASYGSFGLLIDEAYELFHIPPTSALEYTAPHTEKQSKSAISKICIFLRTCGCSTANKSAAGNSFSQLISFYSVSNYFIS